MEFSPPETTKKGGKLKYYADSLILEGILL